ncbi:MAG: TIGR02757 family protein [Ignavibacteria bacterium]
MSKRKLTKQFLEKLYKKYNRLNSADDPIWKILQYKNELDQELLAFIATVYAFGNVKQINNSIAKIFDLFYPSALDKIYDLNFILHIEKSSPINHRFIFHYDFIALIKTLNIVYREFGSLKNLFLQNYNPLDSNLEKPIITFSNNLRKIIQSFNISSMQAKFLFPSPDNRSPCKRMNLFLRWMVRKDNIDFGLWPEIRTSQLVVPVDTHIYRIARYYGLTKLKSPSWNMAVEITDSLKKFDPEDPVKYDFALMHFRDF